MSSSLPLKNLKVLEFGQIAAGPFAGSLLADLGADVVKVENPDGGDGMRDWPPLTESYGEIYSENFASVNRNKRSITVDLKDKDEIAKLLELCKKVDIVLENFRPKVLDKLGLSYENLKKINPKIIYCSISGYGQTGPYSSKGAFDVTVQAMSGLMSVTGEAGAAPVKCGVPVGDFSAGLYAAYTILAAVIRRNDTGLGGRIDCSMLGSLLGISALQTSEYFGTGIIPKKLGSAHPRNAPYQAYQSEDGYFVIAAGNDKLWKSVCDVIEMPDLALDARFLSQKLRAKNQVEMKNIIQPIFLQKTTSYWLKEMDSLGVPCSPINNYEEILNDPHVEKMKLVVPLTLPNNAETKTTAFPVSLSDYEFSLYRTPPKLGANNKEVWDEWMR